MGVEELQLIANILSNMGDISIQGLIWFLGYGLLKYIIGTASILVFIWALYKIGMTMVGSMKGNDRLIAIGQALGCNGMYGSLTESDIKGIHEKIRTSHMYQGKYNESQAQIKQLYSTISELSEQVDHQERELIATKRELGHMTEKFNAQVELNHQLNNELGGKNTLEDEGEDT